VTLQVNITAVVLSQSFIVYIPMAIERLYDYISLESIEADLICKICENPFIDPVTTPCQSTFCRRCIEQWLEDHFSRCPSCPQAVLKRELISFTDLFALAMVNQTQVQCKLCKETNFERRNFQNHIAKECPKAVVTCSTNSDHCPWIGLREELQAHLIVCPSKSLRVTNEGT
jgi:hypothetical protein